MAQEVDGRAIIHGAGSDVEGEPSHLGREEEAKVVTEVSAHDAELVSRAKHKDDTNSVEGSAHAEGIEVVLLTKVDLGLGVNSELEKVVTGTADREDDDGEEVDGNSGVAEENLGEGVPLVLVSGGDVPEKRVENDVGGGEPEKLVGEVDVLLH